MNLMIRYYQASGNSAAKGFELCFDVLEKLGESFPTSLEDAYIKRELTDTNRLLQALPPAALDSLPVMEDKQKLQAMVSLSDPSDPSLFCVWLVCCHT